eukprot:Tbor_TRINITY_DN1905_c0_g1::TRINITY_DN1905_c0_g1_i1::g.3536::m.3536/K10649/TRIM9_67; tripartite motif-containing protein 9/67
MSCPVCLDLLRFPVTLGCGHSMCKVCVLNSDNDFNRKLNINFYPSTRSSSSSGTWSVSHPSKYGIQVACRICQAKSTFSSEAALTVDHNIERMIEILEGSVVTVMPCMRCEDGEGSLSCDECNVKLCEACSDLVHVGRMRNHHISHNVAGQDEVSKPQVCEQMGHEGYRKDLYCVDCRTFLCVLCTQSLPTHRNHQVTTVSEAAQVEKKKLMDAIEAAHNFRQELKNTVTQIDDVIATILRNAGEEVAVFEEAMDKLIHALQEKKASMIDEGRRMCESEVNSLRNSRDNIFSLVTKMNETVAESIKDIRNRSSHLIVARSNEMEDHIRNWEPIVISPTTCPVFNFPMYRDILAGIESLNVKRVPMTDVAQRGAHPAKDIARTLSIGNYTGSGNYNNRSNGFSNKSTNKGGETHDLYSKGMGGGINQTLSAGSRSLLEELSAAASADCHGGASNKINASEPSKGVFIEPPRNSDNQKFKFFKSTFNGLIFSNDGRTAVSRCPSSDDITRPAEWETAMCDALLYSGKHYFEVSIDRYDKRDGHNIVIGLIFDGDYGLCDVIGEDTNSVGLDLGRGTKCVGGDYSLNYLSPYVAAEGDVIGVQIDFADGTLRYYHNGRHMGVAFTGLNRPCYAAVSLINDQQVTLRFPSLPSSQ